MLNKFEEIVLNHFLSDYNKEKSYEEILKDIDCLNNDIIIWHIFEEYESHQVVEMIEDLKDILETNFVIKQELERFIE